MCKYCDKIENIYSLKSESDMEARICIDPDEKELKLTVTTWYEEQSNDYYSPDELVEEETLLVFEANYCPMCGKKLGE